jgi:excisionase family DNA binding protein
MLDGIDHSQTMADIFKGFILDASKLDKGARIAALRSIQALEQCGWHRPAMQEAMEKSGISFDGQSLVFTAKGKAALAAIEQAISIYCESIGCKIDPLNEIYDMSEAAQYLGISKEMMITYVSRQGRLRGKKIGNSMAFSRQQLDEFKRSMRRPGKPTSERADD